MRTFISIREHTLYDLVEATGWLPDDDEDMIADGHGNTAYVVDTADGRLALRVPDDSDVSDVLEAVGFEEELPCDKLGPEDV